MDNTENELFYMIPYGLFGLKEKYSLSDIDILICSIVYTCNRRNKTEYQKGYSTLAVRIGVKLETIKKNVSKLIDKKILSNDKKTTFKSRSRLSFVADIGETKQFIKMFYGILEDNAINERKEKLIYSYVLSGDMPIKRETLSNVLGYPNDKRLSQALKSLVEKGYLLKDNGMYSAIKDKVFAGQKYTTNEDRNIPCKGQKYTTDRDKNIPYYKTSSKTSRKESYCISSYIISSKKPKQDIIPSRQETDSTHDGYKKKESENTLKEQEKQKTPNREELVRYSNALIKAINDDPTGQYLTTEEVKKGLKQFGIDSFLVWVHQDIYHDERTKGESYIDCAIRLKQQRAKNKIDLEKELSNIQKRIKEIQVA